jgi:hypothetical protein
MEYALLAHREGYCTVFAPVEATVVVEGNNPVGKARPLIPMCVEARQPFSATAYRTRNIKPQRRQDTKKSTNNSLDTVLEQGNPGIDEQADQLP